MVKNAGEFRCQYNKEKSGGCPPTSGAEARPRVRRQGVLNIDINEHIVYTIYGEGGTLFLLKVPTSAFTF